MPTNKQIACQWVYNLEYTIHSSISFKQQQSVMLQLSLSFKLNFRDSNSTALRVKPTTYFGRKDNMLADIFHKNVD